MQGYVDGKGERFRGLKDHGMLWIDGWVRAVLCPSSSSSSSWWAMDAATEISKLLWELFLRSGAYIPQQQLLSCEVRVIFAYLLPSQSERKRESFSFFSSRSLA
jgi:hypothetical protein